MLCQHFAPGLRRARSERVVQESSQGRNQRYVVARVDVKWNDGGIKRTRSTFPADTSLKGCRFVCCAAQDDPVVPSAGISAVMHRGFAVVSPTLLD